MKWHPHKYQLDAIKWMVSRPCAGLFLDPGLGKTAIAMAAFRTLHRQGTVRRMLVVSPLRPALSTWPGERAKWDEFSDIKIRVLHGQFMTDYLDDPTVDVHVINPEGLAWLLKKLPASGPLPWDMLVVDESTRFKNTRTQRFQLLRKILPRFGRRYILTGTPVPNGLLDLFGQIFILDLGGMLGQFVTHYRMNYFNQMGYGGYTWVLKEGAERRIYTKIKPAVLRMDANDLIELPELVENMVLVDLPQDAMRMYKQMELTMLAQVREEVISAANVGASLIKCRQIANGGIYHEGGEEWSHVHEAKVDAVEEIIEELSGKPALVAYEYRHDLERLRSRLGDTIPFIGGGVSPSKFREIEAAWNKGELPVLLAQPQSVAHGLNLQGTGAAVICTSANPDYEVDDQFVRRVWRQGQKDRVVRHRIVARGTIDEDIVKLLNRKERTQDALLAALKEKARR